MIRQGISLSLHKRSSGQSLVETAILVPFLLFLVLNAINFGYFFYVAINISSAPRDGALYSIQGYQTPSQTVLPTTTTVSTLVYGNLGRGLPGGASTPVQVCSAAKGVDSTTHKTLCDQFPNGSGVTFPIDVDPETPRFSLNRVDVRYTVQPLIPSNVFGITLLPTLTLHRQVSMRALD